MRALALVLVFSACATAGADARSSDEGPLVIELFTSQGCSSCPAADELLGKLAHAGSLGGRALAPLAFHVDYWDDLGWRDPFSLPAWTERQQAYARALDDRHVYTPELVVGGGAGMVGSNTSRVTSAVAAAPKQTAIAASATWEPDRVTVSATGPDGADVWVAIWQETARTRIERGENRGETAVGERIVRKLERVAGPGRPGTITIALDSTWRAGGAVAFAQRGDRRIIGAKLLPR